MAELKHWEDDKALFLFTSLTAGSSHIVTATSRIETILRNARIPFTYIDTATNESAKKLFQRRARGKKLPLLVKEGFVIADLEEVEELNEFGELEEVIGEVATTATSITTTPAKMAPVREGGDTPSKAAAKTSEGEPATTAAATPAAKSELKKGIVPQQNNMAALLAQEAAAKAKQIAKKVPTPILPKASAEKEATAAKDKEAQPEKEKETPLSPSGVPLPMSPAVKSPTSPTTIKSPTGSVSHHRHSSTGSAHSFIPEKSEPEVREHRGSEISIASEDEIKRIESECTIAEEDEEDEDAILFGDADKEDEVKDKEKAKPAEDKEIVDKKKRTTSMSQPVLEPVHEEKPVDEAVEEDEDDANDEDDEDEDDDDNEEDDDEEAQATKKKPSESAPPAAPRNLNIKGGPAKIQAIMASAGIAPPKPEAHKPDDKKTLESSSDEEEEDDEDDDEDDEEEDEEPPTAQKSKSAPAAVSATTDAEELAPAVDKVKIQDQDAAEPAQASVSVKD